MNWMLAVKTVAIALSIPAVAAAQAFRAIELGTLPARPATPVATDINNRGQVVGVAGGEVFVWELATGIRSLAIAADNVLINNAGIIVGTRFVSGSSQLFAWVDGVVSNLPGPPESTWILRGLTDNGIVLVCGARCWGVYAGAVYDLDLLAGAAIFAVNEAATLGGALGTDAYLRFWDGRVIIPWGAATFPETPGPGTVELIGAGGHFAGRSGQRAWYGMPDGSAFPTGLAAPARGGFGLRDINRRGDVVGLLRAHNLLPQLDTAFLYADGRLIDLSAAVVSGPNEIRDALAINDERHIVAAATIEGVRRSVVLVPDVPAPPSALSFSVDGRVVTLTWAPSAGAQDYVVEAGSVSGASDLYNTAVGALPSLVTPAPPGRYYVRVRARNASGVSAPSNEVIIEIRESH